MNKVNLSKAISILILALFSFQLYAEKKVEMSTNDHLYSIMKTKDYKALFETATKAIKEDETNYYAWFARGFAIHHLYANEASTAATKAHAETIASFKKASELNPKSENVFYWLAYSYSEYNIREAVSDETRREEEKNGLEAYQKLFDLQSKNKSTSQNDLASTLVQIASLQLALQDQSAADATLETLEKIDPKNADSWLSYADQVPRVYNSSFKTKLLMINRALAIDPTKAHLWKYKSWVCANLPGRSYDPEGLEAIKKAVELEPTNSEYWKSLGHTLKRVGKPEEAEQAYAKSKELQSAQ